MLFSALFWLILAALALLLLSALLVAVRRRGRKGGGNAQEEPAPISVSGVYSLIRKSPRKELREREPSLENMQAALASSQTAGLAGGSAQQYLDEWRKSADLSLGALESGDKEGVQTYRYQVPEKCLGTCSMFAGSAYVTREQLHDHVQLIPPFHLGCGVRLAAKEAWSDGSDGSGWAPILPVNGRYQTPDWRSVVKL